MFLFLRGPMHQLESEANFRQGISQEDLAQILIVQRLDKQSRFHLEPHPRRQHRPRRHAAAGALRPDTPDAHNVEPDLVAAAAVCERAGARSITVHLRADRRHLQDQDVARLRRKRADQAQPGNGQHAGNSRHRPANAARRRVPRAREPPGDHDGRRARRPRPARGTRRHDPPAQRRRNPRQPVHRSRWRSKSAPRTNSARR